MDLTHTLIDGRRERQRKGKKWFRIRQEDRLYKCKVQGARCKVQGARCKVQGARAARKKKEASNQAQDSF
jgi:hypothetical protein